MSVFLYRLQPLMPSKIKKKKNLQEYLSRAEFRLPGIPAEEAVPEKRAPVRVKFEIPYFTVSGRHSGIAS